LLSTKDKDEPSLIREDVEAGEGKEHERQQLEEREEQAVFVTRNLEYRFLRGP
jgi:hypothetical protein